MSRTSIRRAGALAGAIGMLLAAAPAMGAGPVDQSQTDATFGGGFITGPEFAGRLSHAQTFTAGRTGTLDQVDVHLEERSASNVGGVTVEIRDTAGGDPVATPLVQVVVPRSSIQDLGGGGAFVGVPIPLGVPVTSGTVYAIVVYAGGMDSFQWRGSSAQNAYAAGTWVISSSKDSPPTGWSPGTGEDLAFRTYVTGTGPACERPAVTHTGTPAANTISGTAGEDRILGLAGSDTLLGLDGDDCLEGGADQDTLRGGAGADDLLGGDGQDVLEGGPGEDRLDGGAGHDRVEARDGVQDTVTCGAGNDVARLDALDVLAPDHGCETIQRI